MSNHTQSTWKSQGGYIWALIGSAVGFANILSFSAQAYKNGGGAYLIPYIIALFVLGIPMLVLEGLIGYKWKKPLVAAYDVVLGKQGKTLGWLAVIACLTIGGFYIVLTGYAAAYTYFYAFNQIPADPKSFFLDSFLQATSGIGEFGSFSIPIFCAMMAVAIATWFVLVRNVKDGIEKICSFFMPLMVIIVASFAIIVCFLPGGMNGWAYYLKPDFAKLSNPSLWRDVFGQLFFSLSIGLGIIVGYSRHTGKSTNIPRAMLYVALGDFAVSFIAGAAIFGCLAHVSFIQGIPFNEIVTSDSTFEIGFILFPHILQAFGPVLSQVIGVIFFACVLIAGITGVFSIVESIAGNVEVEFGISRKAAVSATLGLLSMAGTLFCMGNASHVIDALVPMVLGTNMLIGGLGLVVGFYFSSKGLANDPVWNQTFSASFFKITLRYLTPGILGTILIWSLVDEFQFFDMAKGVRWAWFAIAFVMASTAAHFGKQKQMITT